MEQEVELRLPPWVASLAYHQRDSPMQRANLVSLLELFTRFGGDAAVVQRRGYRREKWTYGELQFRVRLWTCVLGAWEIGPGDRVLLWGDNSVEWIACFWGIQLRGAIAVPMDRGASLEFVKKTIHDAGIKLIVRDRALAEISEIPSVILENPQGKTGETTRTDEPVTREGERSERKTIAEILYTSGTTGEPRGVVLTHGNFLANLEQIEKGIAEYGKYERWMHPLRFVSLVPLSHVFGQFMTLFVPPLLGATVVLESSNKPPEILRTIKKEKATVLIAVPRMLDALRSAIEREIDARGWSPWFERAKKKAEGQIFWKRAWIFRRIHRMFGWKFWAFICGGAALSSETELFFKKLGFAVVQGYGMTETASLISLNHPFRATEGSVGKILPGRAGKSKISRTEEKRNRYFGGIEHLSGRH